MKGTTTMINLSDIPRHKAGIESTATIPTDALNSERAMLASRAADLLRAAIRGAMAMRIQRDFLGAMK